MTGKKAWVTLATNDTYCLGALVLAHSLKKVNTAHELVVLVTSNVSFVMRGTLQNVFNEVKEVNIIDSGDVDNLRLLARPELGITFTKLHCWRLTQYEKCVFLDADTLVLQNCDELFEREELSAAPDIGWPDCFNSGVFVFKPSEETYNAIIEFALAHGSFDGGDQGLLNMYYSNWSTGGSSKRLPFLYNLSSAAIYSYLPAFKWYGKGVKIVHFIGGSKPWLQAFNSVTRTVQPDPNSSHLTNFLQYWWNLFCDAVYPQLSPEMTRLLLRSWFTPNYAHNTHNPFRINPSRIYPQDFHNLVNIPQTIIEPETVEHFVFSDPWEQFEKVLLKETRNNYNRPAANDNKPTNKLEDMVYEYSNHISHPNRLESSIEDSPKNTTFIASSRDVYNKISVSNAHVNDHWVEQKESNFDHIKNIFINDENNIPNCNVNSEAIKIMSAVPTDSSTFSNFDSNSVHSLPEVLPEERDSSNLNHDTNDHAGLASSFARMKLGEVTLEQAAREDELRRQNWEQGNMDYMGRDSFDNIWNKISQTLNQAESKSETQTETAVPSAVLSDADTSQVRLPVKEKSPPKSTNIAEPAPSNPFPSLKPASPAPDAHSKASSESKAPTTTELPPLSSLSVVSTAEVSPTPLKPTTPEAVAPSRSINTSPITSTIVEKVPSPSSGNTQVAEPAVSRPIPAVKPETAPQSTPEAVLASPTATACTDPVLKEKHPATTDTAKKVTSVSPQSSVVKETSSAPEISAKSSVTSTAAPELSKVLTQSSPVSKEFPKSPAAKSAAALPTSSDSTKTAKTEIPPPTSGSAELQSPKLVANISAAQESKEAQPPVAPEKINEATATSADNKKTVGSSLKKDTEAKKSSGKSASAQESKGMQQQPKSGGGKKK